MRWISSVLELVGIGVAAVGFGLAWLPLGLIVAGVGLVFVGFALDGDEPAVLGDDL